MKTQELRNLIREEVKKTLTEAKIQYEFDLTDISGESWKKVLSQLGMDWKSGKIEDSLRSGNAQSDFSQGSPMWTWKSPTLTVMSGNNPITGKYSRPGTRADEKDYASFILLRGEASDVATAKRLIKTSAIEIKEQISEAAIPTKVMDMLQPVLDAIADGTINKKYHNDVIAAIKDAMIKTTPGGGKFRVTNHSNGVVSKVSNQNNSGTAFLSMKDGSLEPVVVKRSRTGKQYFINPKTNQNLNYTSLNQLAIDYAAGKLN